MPLSSWILVEALAFIGSVIGFFIIKYRPGMPNFKFHFLVSIGGGMSSAFIIYGLLVDPDGYAKQSHITSMMIAVAFAHGGTDSFLWIIQTLRTRLGAKSDN